MIAMQYSIALPRDYDMAIIRRRIAVRGHLMDGFPGLIFKAYASADVAGEPPGAEGNVYAPLYLWDSVEGMNAFLCGPGFAGLAHDFGRPAVRTWSVWRAWVSPQVTQACYATREHIPIAPGAALDALREAAQAVAEARMAEPGALAALVGFDPTAWTQVRFQLWGAAHPPVPGPGVAAYTIGHVSTAAA
ncbi:DUF4865 family protein [Denitromonas sp.]|uniref:DUF4865 family protein n=1 Tax=Denitromonas sp. TaxID=2734609 RepID=UPI003A89F954